MPTELLRVAKKRDGVFTPEQRRYVSGQIRYHRKVHLRVSGHAYNRKRGLDAIPKTNEFDIKKMLTESAQERNKQGRKMRVLNAGGGHMMLERDVRKLLGTQVHITSLNLVNTKITQQQIEALHEAENKTHTKEEALKRRLLRERTARIATRTDKVLVGTAEKRIIGKKFDYIFDSFGPLLYGVNPAMVFENYLEALTNGGRLIASTPSAYFTMRLSQHFARSSKGGLFEYLYTDMKKRKWTLAYKDLGNGFWIIEKIKK